MSPVRTNLSSGLVVAIPVRDEADRITDCLRALCHQVDVVGCTPAIVLLLNNCTDNTARVVADLRSRLRVTVRVIERHSPDANAGWARREAMDAAACWLEEEGRTGGIILTTDADSRVPVDWIARNRAALATGVDAVAGRVALDEEESAGLPAALHDNYYDLDVSLQTFN